MKIEDLPLRFAAIATEIGTGHEIWLTRGRLSEALRASYALPGIFPAVQVGDRWLMDGALVNPVPVSAARALGARIVIAVNVNTDLFGRGTTIQDYGAAESEPPIEEEAVSRGVLGLFGAEKNARRRFFGTAGRPGLSNVMVEAFNVMQDRITRARLAGDPPDVMISPRIGRIGLFEFHRAEEAIAIGAEATEKALRGFRRDRCRAGVDSHSRRDVLAQRGALALDLSDAPLHDVADRDDADELALIDDRHVTEFALGHALHDDRNRVGLGAGRDLARHDGSRHCPRAPRARARRRRARCRARTECPRRDCPDR